MGWTLTDSAPVYLQLVGKIRADILSGRYAPNAPFPTVRALACEAAVNPNTMQRALLQLESEGLLYTKGTVGRFVTDDTAVLEAARRRARDEALAKVLQVARELGLGKAELLRYIEKEEEWNA